jgi:hypothetical protein
MANKPNNPSLWSKAKSLAKQKFDVYPCVPLDSQALTKEGWKQYHELTVGEEILSYNKDTGLNEWTPILALQYFKDAPVIRLYKSQTKFDIKCTPNHKWVLDSANVKYPNSLVEAQDITTHMKIKTSAPIKAEDQHGIDLQVFSKSDSWVKKVLMMSVSQLQSFFASGIVYDGNDKGLTSKGDKQTFGFSQKNQDHGDAMEIAAVLLGYRVCSVVKKHNPSMRSWTFITRSFESTQNLKKEDAGIEDVWCPTTKNQTWIMKQNGYVTITGNSAYANGWAAKWYKGKGGTWRKAKEGMEVPYMEEGGKPEWLLEAQLKAQGYSGDALRNKLSSMMNGGMMFREVAGGDISIPNLNKLEMGGYFPRFMEDGGYTGTFSGNAYYKDGGEANGSMALGQMSAVVDKLSKLRQFVGGDDNLDPWIASKLAVMDHSADAIYDYLAYGEDEEDVEEEEAPMTEMEMEQMKEGGGIPERYKSKGFTKVGVKRQSNRPGKKWMVLAKKGDQYKIVHGGYKGMKDFSQHGSNKRKKNFWNRMGGKQSSKATDPFSPLYWHKRFGTWQEGGLTPQQGDGQEEQIMQLIQAYSQISQVDPREIMQQLQQMQPEEQQQALQQMMQVVEQSSGGAQQQPMMKMGGGAPCYKCGGSYQYGGQMGGSYMPGIPAVSVYDLPIYQEQGLYEGNSKRQPVFDEQDAIVAQANEEALAQYPGPQMPQFMIEQPEYVVEQPEYRGSSIVDYLSNAGVNSSYSSRKELAKELGISNYRGTAAQNLEMLSILRGGKSSIPTGNVTAKAAAKKAENKSIVEEKIQKDSSSGSMINPVPVKAKPGTPKTLPGKKKSKAEQFIENDPYFFAEESDPQWVKVIDSPFTWLRNLGAKVALDQDPLAAGQLLLAGLMSRGLVGKTKTVPYASPKGPKSLPGGPNTYLPAPRQVPTTSPLRPGAPSGGYMKIGEDFGTLLGPRGFQTGSGMRSPGFPMYAYGGYMDPAWMKAGGININPANKGKFTASANRAGMGVQEFASHVLANREDYSPTQVKRANFARNAAKWKKQEGGYIDVGSYVDDTPEMRAWLDANGYTYE